MLEKTPNKGECFHYTEKAMHRISISLPLVKDKVYSRKECLPFFNGLLPDGDQRERMARACHISSESVMKLLARFGRDIAGSLSILEEDESPDTVFAYVPISEMELESKILQSNKVSLFALPDKNIRSSLAGAMDKIPLSHKDDSWFLPVGDAPSNVIIKPHDRYSENEYLCTSLAKACGILTPDIALKTFGTAKAFVSNRFDREVKNERLERIHQEDFCQALGIDPEKKYEEDGGPGYKDYLSLIWKESSLPIVDYKRFLEVTVFNYLIDNCDAHGKNLSFLYHHESDKVRLAPFYDLVCSTIYPEFSRN
ncbi:MAG: HipA domain-containing protein, partial [Spirochaetales bacterium]|nr:HipA domain-containing protein [Candidatus Physcosoma equi]